MLDSKQCEAFIAVIQTGSFDKASKKLYLTPSAITSRINALEHHVGNLLVQRGKPCVATHQGTLLLNHLQQAHLLEANLLKTLQQPLHHDFYKITIAANADSLATWLLPVLKQPLIDNQIIVEILVDDQSQTSNLMLSGLANACLSIESKAMKGCEAVYLGKMRYQLRCTVPFFNKWFGDNPTREHYRSAPAVIFNDKDYLHFDFMEQHFGLSKGSYPYHIVPSSESFVTAIYYGLGYGLIPDLQLANHTDSRAFKYLAPQFYIDVPLYWHYWQNQSAMLAELTAQIIKATQSVLVR